MLKPAPDFRRMLGDVARHKALARNAYKHARAVETIPASLLDRLWIRTLQATDVAPAAVALRMFRRSETMMRLMTDHAQWPTSPPRGRK
jgi:hypothetical protein